MSHNQILAIEKIDLLDLDAIKQLQPEGWTDITKEFEFYVSSSFCYPVKITIDERIVAIGAAIILGKTAWLAHIITDKEYRNKGLGSKVVAVLLQYLDANSIETRLLIATELGLPVYRKFGFRIVSEYVFFKRDRAWVPKSINSKLVPYSPAYFASVMEMDKRVTGEVRGALLYKYLPTSYVYLDNGKVLGYYIPDLRDGPIVALTPNVGLELMKLKYSRVDKAVIPSENKEGIKFLLQNGFVVSETKGTRMIMGRDILWRPEMIYSRISGNFG